MEFAPGEKTHKDENFPVASWLISKKHRAPVLAFYRFARAADDVADHPDLPAAEKIARLNQFEATLLGESDAISAALPLREALARHHLPSRHALDLLIAFRQDARLQRYENWGELLQYCAYSAAPVGRFVLEVHGESPAVWPASDALCTALQIVNHLQDCGDDYRNLKRIYIPQDVLARYDVAEAELAAARATPGLRRCLQELAQKTQGLLTTPLAPQVQDVRLRIEVSSIETVAHKLLHLLELRDPLSERVHLRKMQLLVIMIRAALTAMAPRNSARKMQPLLQENA